MTPEQMREAAAQIVRHCGYRDLAKAIDDIPLTPPEPPMRDRIARVIYGDENVRTSKAAFQAALEDADEVLETMREPTEAMVAKVTLGELSRYQVACIWRAMIDAALAEK